MKRGRGANPPDPDGPAPQPEAENSVPPPSDAVIRPSFVSVKESRPPPGRRTPSHGFQSLAEVLSGGVPEIDWLARPVFTSNALGLIGASAKAFKSWMLGDLVVAVTNGISWLGSFPVHRAGPVVLVSPEGGVWGLSRRIDAILRSVGGLPADVAIAWVRTRGLALTAPSDVADLRAAVRESGPVLIAYDSVYAGLSGIRMSQLNDFAGALRVVSDMAGEAGAAVVVTHHLNKMEGEGLARLSGAGPAEWASAAVLGKSGPRLTVDGATTATMHWSLVARDVPECEFSTTFHISSPDPSSLSAPLDYRVETTVGDTPSSPDGLGFVEGRVLGALKLLGSSGGGLRAINDVLVQSGHPFRHETLQKALDVLADDLNLADGGSGTWWATSARADS